jgi:hypothetical protein
MTSLADLARAADRNSPEFNDFVDVTRVLLNKAKSFDDLTRYTAMRWLNCFLMHAVNNSHDSMLMFLTDLFVAVLSCMTALRPGMCCRQESLQNPQISRR